MQPSDLAVRGAEQSGREIGGAFRSIGQDIGGAVQQYQDRQDATAQTNAYSDINMAMPDLYSAGETAVKTGDPNDHNLVPEWAQNTLAPIQQKIRDKYSDASQKVQDAVNTELVRQNTELQMHLHGVQADIAGKAAVDNAQIGTDALQRQVIQHPETLQSALDASDRAGNAMAGAVPTALIPKYNSGNRAQLAGTAADALIGKLAANPTPEGVAALRQQISDPNGSFYPNLKPDDLQRANSTLDKIQFGMQGTQAAIDAQTLGNINQNIRDGLGGEDQAASIINEGGGKKTPDETKIWQADEGRKLADSIAYGKAASWGKTHADSDITVQLADLNNQRTTASANDIGPLERQVASLTEFQKNRDKAMSEDAPGYVIKNYPSVQAAYGAFQNNPSPQTFATYATASAGAQAMITGGAPAKILPTDFKNKIKTQMMQVDQTPQGAALAGNTLQDLRTVTGPYYNNAVHELERDKIISPAQFALAQIMGTPEGFALGQEGLRAQATPENILNTTSGATQGVAEAKIRNALAPLMATFSDTVNGHELMAGYINAGASIMRARGKDAMTDATASDLVNTMVMDRFNIRNNLRIPKNLDDHDVANGADIIQAHIGEHDIQPPPSFSGMGPALQKDAYIRDIQDYGYWSTNDRGDGAVLRYQGSPVYEKGKDGQNKPIEIPFDALQDAGRKNRSAYDIGRRAVMAPSTLGSLDMTAPHNSFSDK